MRFNGKTLTVFGELGDTGAYEAGRKAGNDQFWDCVQDNGNKTNYYYGFYNWGAEYIRPKCKVVPTTVESASSTFNACKKLKKVESAYFDFSQKPTGTSNGSGYYYTFHACHELEEIEDIGLMPQNNYHTTFGSCSVLHTIAKIGVNENTQFENTFAYCHELQNLTIDGTIGQNGFSVAYSKKLTHDSLISIINAIKTFTDGTTKTVTLGATNIAKLTDAEKAIATQKGWTLA